MLMVNMLERMALITIFIYVILQTNIMKCFVKDKFDRKDNIMMILIFSLLAIFRNLFWNIYKRSIISK